MKHTSVLFGLALVACAFTQAHAFVLTLKPSASPARHYVSLEDVADITGLPEGPTLDAMRRMRIATLPQPGDTVRLTRQYIATTLRYAYPAMANQAEWRGSDSIEVLQKTQSLSMHQLYTQAHDALKSALSTRVRMLKIEPAESTVGDLLIPKGDFRITALPIPPDSLSQRMRVNLMISIGQSYQKQLALWFKVQGILSAPVAKAEIDAGVRLNPDMFEVRDISLSDLAGITPIEMSQGEVMRTRHALSAGTVISQLNAEVAPMVARQEPVSVQVKANGISLQTMGVALSDGELGKVVRIRNTRSGEEFLAQVTGPGTAKVLMR